MISRLPVAALALALLAACTPAQPPKPPAAQSDGLYHLSEQFKDLRFAWTAEPGIDLVHGPMVAIRAFAESELLGGASNKESDLYPGFPRAVLPSAPPEASSPREQFGLWPIASAEDFKETPWLAEASSKSQGGVDYEHVLSLTPLNDDQWAAVICTGGYSVLYQQADGKWSHLLTPKYRPLPTSSSQILPDAGWGGVERVVVRKTPEAASSPSATDDHSPLAAQQGPLPAPQIDPFGAWQVIGRISVGPPDGLMWLLPDMRPQDVPNYKGKDWSDGSWGEEDWIRAHDECMQKAPDPRETQVRWMLGEHDGPYPYPAPLPAPVPGWPAAREG